MGSIFGAIGAISLLAGALLMMRFGEGKAFYVSVVLCVAGLGTLLVAADMMENAVVTIR